MRISLLSRFSTGKFTSAMGFLSFLALFFVMPKAQALTMQEIIQGLPAQNQVNNGQVLGATSQKKVKPIALEGRVAGSKKPKAKAELISPTSGQVLSTQEVESDENGNYTVDFSALGSDPVNLKLKVDGFLSKTIQIDNPVAVNSVDVTLPELTGGDVNNDGIINTQDANDVQNQWNKNGQGNEAYDVNGDGIINSLDFAIIKNNLNKAGQ